ncbi:hypothetical protein [Embleya sp. MST-111070]|uniref:hypothetical protein n=1 Tax=Embleya sp. MST-111070 TaxID=3398231 RepID=UPI003F7331DE
MRELHGEAADWSLTDHLLANAVDHLAVANWMFETVHKSEESEGSPFPVPTPRPVADAASSALAEQPREETSAVDPGILASFFSR